VRLRDRGQIEAARIAISRTSSARQACTSAIFPTSPILEEAGRDPNGKGKGNPENGRRGCPARDVRAEGVKEELAREAFTAEHKLAVQTRFVGREIGAMSRCSRKDLRERSRRAQEPVSKLEEDPLQAQAGRRPPTSWRTRC